MLIGCAFGGWRSEFDGSLFAIGAAGDGDLGALLDVGENEVGFARACRTLFKFSFAFA
jgi:hypothetical protein